MPERIFHTSEPVFDSRSRILILGTMPSPKSREEGFFYAHPQNRFWPVLAELFGEPLPVGRNARRAFALCHRIALWDVLSSCTIEGADDGSIRDAAPNDLSPIFAAADIRAVFTTGGAASRLYRKHLAAKTGMDCVPLPSTSPANCRFFTYGQILDAYRAILPLLSEPDQHMPAGQKGKPHGTA